MSRPYDPAAKKRYYEKHKEVIKAKRKTYYEKTRDRTLERHRTAHSRYLFSRNKARREGREFDLDFDLYCAYLKEPCKYCDGPLNSTGVGLDRKDSSKGYVVGNVVACCLACNRIKNEHLTHDEMRVAMDAVMRFRRTGEM